MTRSVSTRSCLVLALTILMLAGCDDDGVAPSTGSIGGQVSGPLPSTASATVYLAEMTYPPLAAGPVPAPAPLPPPTIPVWLDSTATDAGGSYLFTDLDPGYYVVYAGRRTEVMIPELPTLFDSITPLSPLLRVGSPLYHASADLVLQAAACAGELSGRVVMDLAPVAGVPVGLWELDGFFLWKAEERVTDENGHYAFQGVCTGNYVIQTIAPPDGLPIGWGILRDVWCEGTGVQELPDLVMEGSVVRKPAVYLYPERPTHFRVELRTAPGVRIIASDPPYGDGWEVDVEPGGLIDGRLPYLFYEAALSGSIPVAAGWCIARPRLAAELPARLAELGLSAVETADCLQYWLPALQESGWWAVEPVLDEQIERWVGLEVSPAPDSVRRVWLIFRPLAAPASLSPPAIPPFAREGTVLVEWGGAIAGAGAVR